MFHEDFEQATTDPIEVESNYLFPAEQLDDRPETSKLERLKTVIAKRIGSIFIGNHLQANSPEDSIMHGSWR